MLRAVTGLLILPNPPSPPLLYWPGTCATITSNWLRATLGLMKTALPLWSMPCKANTFLARSMPTVTMLKDFPFRLNVSIRKFNLGSNSVGGFHHHFRIWKYLSFVRLSK